MTNDIEFGSPADGDLGRGDVREVLREGVDGRGLEVTALEGDHTESGYRGRQTFLHGKAAFTLELEGPGEIDWSIEGGTGRLSIDKTRGTDSDTDLRILDHSEGTLSIRFVHVASELGHFACDTHVESVEVMPGGSVGEFILEDGGGVLSNLAYTGNAERVSVFRAHVELLAVGESLLGDIFVQGDLTCATVTGSVEGKLGVSGNADTIVVGGDVALGASIELEGDARDATIKGSCFGSFSARAIEGEFTFDHCGAHLHESYPYPVRFEFDGASGESPVTCEDGLRVDVGEDRVVAPGTSVELHAHLGADEPGLDFSGAKFSACDGSREKNPQVRVENSGATLHIRGNGWKQVDLPYTVTEATVLEFEFMSNAQGEIHGIGLDVGGVLGSETTFKLYGTHNWGRSEEIPGYSGFEGEWVHYRIPIGRFRTGEAAHLFFANDHDVTDPDGESRFSNVRIHECPRATSSARAIHYTWTQIGGPAVVVSGASSPHAHFTAPCGSESVDVEFELVVTDGVTRASDSLTVTVQPHDTSVPDRDQGLLDPTDGLVGGTSFAEEWPDAASASERLIELISEAIDLGSLDTEATTAVRGYQGFMAGLSRILRGTTPP